MSVNENNLRGQEEENKVFSNWLKILVVVKHLKLLFYYFSINSNNSPMGLKIRYCKFMDENSFVIYDQKIRSMKSAEKYIDY